MDTQKDSLEQQALILEPVPEPEHIASAPESNETNLQQLFERLNDQQDQDGPDINEQLYLAEEEFDTQAYADYAAMQNETALVEPEESSAEVSPEVKDGDDSSAETDPELVGEASPDAEAADADEAAELDTGSDSDQEVDDNNGAAAPLHRFVLSGLTGKSWEVQSSNIGDVVRQFASSRAAVLKMLRDDDEVWLVSGEHIGDGSTWKSHYYSPAMAHLVETAQLLDQDDSERLSADTDQLNAEFDSACTAVEQELGLTPAPVSAIEAGPTEQPEINNGMAFLESGASLSSYVQRYRDALAAESGRQLQNAREATGNDHVADQRLANTNPRELERNSQNAQKGQQPQEGGRGVTGPSLGDAFGSLAALGVQGISKLANSLSMAGGNIAQTISGHSYHRTENALSTVMSQAEQDIALLKGMGLQDVADADADSKPSLRTAFLAQDGVKPLLAKLGSNIDQAEILASSLIRKGQAGSIEPDRVMRDSLGTVGNFAKRHKALLDELHDKQGKSFSERLDGVATGLLTYLKTLAMALANRLNLNAGAPAAAGPRMG